MAKKNEYYFGGVVPREIQEKLEKCRDRGLRVQTIARKLAYLFLSMPEERQNQLYLSTIDEQFDPTDKATADLLAAVDDIFVGYILAKMPKSARLVESFAAAQGQKKAPARRKAPRKPA